MNTQDELYNVIRDGMHLTVYGSELKETDVIKGLADVYGQNAQIIKNADSYDLDTCEQDTREKLEADVHQYANPSGYKNTLGASWEKKMLSFLDRQAAITERELCSRCSPYATAKDYLDTIDELTAERDELQAAIDAMENGQFYAMYKAKCEECEQLKKVVRTKAESFKKLECELAGKQ